MTCSNFRRDEVTTKEHDLGIGEIA